MPGRFVFDDKEATIKPSGRFTLEPMIDEARATAEGVKADVLKGIGYAPAAPGTGIPAPASPAMRPIRDIITTKPGTINYGMIPAMPREPLPEGEYDTGTEIGRQLVGGLTDVGGAVGLGLEATGRFIEEAGKPGAINPMTGTESLTIPGLDRILAPIAERLKATGEQVGNYWGDTGEQFKQSADILGNVVDRPDLLTNPKWWASNVARMGPGLAAAIMVGIATGGTATMMGAGTGLAGTAGALGGGMAGGLMEGAGTRRTALERGMTEDQAVDAGAKMALASGMLNAISLGRMMDDTVKNKLLRFIMSGGTEAVTEAMEEPTEGLIFGEPWSEFKERLKSALTVMGPAFLTGGVGGIPGGPKGRDTDTGRKITFPQEDVNLPTAGGKRRTTQMGGHTIDVDTGEIISEEPPAPATKAKTPTPVAPPVKIGDTVTFKDGTVAEVTGRFLDRITGPQGIWILVDKNGKEHHLRPDVLAAQTAKTTPQEPPAAIPPAPVAPTQQGPALTMAKVYGLTDEQGEIIKKKVEELGPAEAKAYYKGNSPASKYAKALIKKVEEQPSIQPVNQPERTEPVKTSTPPPASEPVDPVPFMKPNTDVSIPARPAAPETPDEYGFIQRQRDDIDRKVRNMKSRVAALIYYKGDSPVAKYARTVIDRVYPERKPRVTDEKQQIIDEYASWTEELKKEGFNDGEINRVFTAPDGTRSLAVEEIRRSRIQDAEAKTPESISELVGETEITDEELAAALDEWDSIVAESEAREPETDIASRETPTPETQAAETATGDTKTRWQQAQSAATERIRVIEDEWSAGGFTDEQETRIHKAIEDTAKEYGVPAGALRKQVWWEPARDVKTVEDTEPIDMREFLKQGGKPESFEDESEAVSPANNTQTAKATQGELFAAQPPAETHGLGEREQAFIRSKVEKFGSRDAAMKFYSGKSPVDMFGRDVIDEVYEKAAPPATTLAPAAVQPEPTPVFIRDLSKTEQKSEALKRRAMRSLPPKEGHEVVYKPYGDQGRGFYYKPVKAAPITGQSVQVEIPPRPLVKPHSSAMQRDKQLRDQQAWDKKYGKKTETAQPPKQAIAEAFDQSQRANKLRAVADGMQNQINEKRNPAIANQNVTARRANIAAGMASEADHMEQTQKILRGMAAAVEDGTLPEILTNMNSKAFVEYLVRAGKQRNPIPTVQASEVRELREKIKGMKGSAEIAHYISGIISREDRDIRWVPVYGMDEVNALETLIKLADKKEPFKKHGTWVKEGVRDAKRIYTAGMKNSDDIRAAAKALEQYISPESPEVTRKRAMDKAKRELIGIDIPGFFPTPKPVVSRLIEKAGIEPGQKILEPSAGMGDIADALVEAAGKENVDTAEIVPRLQEYLKLKGYNPKDDFLEIKDEYDRIVMNPPFEKLQDIDHVKHAYSILKPGGRMVSIMSESPFFRSDKKAADFREWLDEAGGTSEILESGAFTGKEAFRQTGVASRIVVIDKPARTAPASPLSPPVTITGDKVTIIPGDWIVSKDGILRGKVIGEGTIGKNIPAWKIDRGGGKQDLITKTDAKLWFKAEKEPTPPTATLPDGRTVDTDTGEVITEPGPGRTVTQASVRTIEDVRKIFPKADEITEDGGVFHVRIGKKTLMVKGAVTGEAKGETATGETTAATKPQYLLDETGKSRYIPPNKGGENGKRIRIPDADSAATGKAAKEVAGPSAAQRKTAIQGLERSLEVSEGDIREIPVPDREDSKLAVRIANIFGHQPIFIDVKGGKFPFYGVEADGIVFINNVYEHPHIDVVSHEITHVLRKEHPDLYRQLFYALHEDTHAYSLFVAQPRKFKYTDEELAHEFVAITVAERMTEKGFWRNLYAKIPDAVRNILNSLNRIISTIALDEKYKTSTYFKDIKKVRDTIDSVMAEYARRVAAKADEPRFMTRVAERDERSTKSPSTRITGPAVERAVNDIAAKFNVPARVVATAAELPGGIKNAAMRRQSEGNVVLGIYHGGKVWIVAEHMRSADEARKVFIHEAIGHYGLRKVMGKDFNSFLSFLVNDTKYGAEIKTFAEENGIGDQREAADEWFARQAETMKPNSSLWSRFMFHVRKWLRSLSSSLGVTIEYGKPELVELLRVSREAARKGGTVEASGTRYRGEVGVKGKTIPDTMVIDGKSRPTRNSEGRLIYTTEEGIRNFWKWFGDSKVVDEQGRPRVVYHGTASKNITRFLPDGGNKETSKNILRHYLKAKEKNEPYGYMNFRGGSFFSPDPNYAAHYTAENTGSIYPTYIAAENPVYFDMVLGKAHGVNPNKTPDALILIEGEKTNEIAIIDPTQIKSATGNTGAFSAEDDDIRFSTRLSPDATREEAEADVARHLPVFLTEAAQMVRDVFAKRGKNWSRDMKPDVSLLDRNLSLLSHYAEKVPGLYRAWEAAVRIPDYKMEFENAVFRSVDGGTKYLEVLDSFQKDTKRKLEVNLWKNYIFTRDRDEIGYQVRPAGPDHPGVYNLVGNNGNIITSSEDPEALWVDAIRREAVDAPFSPEGKKALVAYRIVSHNIYHMLRKGAEEAIKAIQKSGGEIPKVPAWRNGKQVEISLPAALALMGEKRGWYMPRIRKSGAYALIAKKQDEQPILEFFDTKTMLAIRQGQLEREGYTVTKDVSKRLSEDVYAAAGSAKAVQDMLQAAIDHMTKGPNRTLTISDFGFSAKWDKTTLILTGMEKHDYISDILKEHGGNRHPMRGNQSQWVFKYMDTPKLEKLVRALAEQGDILFDPDLLFSQMLVDEVANVVRERGARSHMMKRVGGRGKGVWSGYEQDPITAITLEGKGVAGAAAKHRAAKEMIAAATGTEITWAQYRQKEGDGAKFSEYREMVKERRIDPQRQKGANDAFMKLFQDILRNDDRTDRVFGVIKGLAVLKYLSFRLAAPLVNLTALPMSAAASVSGYTGAPLTRAMGYLGEMVGQYTKFKTGRGVNAEDAALFEEIEKRGWHIAQFNREAITTLKSKFGRTTDRIMDVGMFLFGATEQLNRAVTIAAGYKAIKAKSKGPWTPEMHRNALTRAKQISDKAHAVYGKANAPEWARGTGLGANAARSMYVFRTFTHNYLLTMLDLAGGDANAKKAALWMATSGAILGGAAASVLFNVACRTLGLVVGDDPEEWLYHWIEEHLGDRAEMVARHGLPGLVGITIKGSLEIDLASMPTSILDFLGAPGSIVTDVTEGFRYLTKGEIQKGFEKALPLGPARMVQAVREGTEGVTSRTNVPLFFGNEKVRLTPIEAAWKFLSFTPSRTTMIREKQWAEKKREKHYSEQRTDIYARVRDYFNQPPAKRTPEKWAGIIEDAREFNVRARKWGISPIRAQDIRGAARNTIRAPKKERLRGMIPAQMRQ